MTSGKEAHGLSQPHIQTLATEFLNNKAEQAAKKLGASHYHIHATPLTKQTRLPSCKNTITYRDLSEKDYGKQYFKIICQPQWEAVIKGRIQIFLPVIVASKNISKNKTVSEQELDWKIMDISLIPSEYLRTPEAVLHKTARQPIKKGTPVNTAMFK